MYIYTYICIYIHIYQSIYSKENCKENYSKENIAKRTDRVGSNPTRANFLYGMGKLEMNTIYIGKFRYTPMINSKYKFETLVWRLMKGL